MKDEPTNNNQTSIDDYRFGLSWGLIAAPLLALLVYWLTLSQGAPIAGAMAVTVFAAVLWISEALPLPVTALLIPVGLAAVGVFEANAAFHSFGNSVLFLVLGGYALAVAVETNGVDRWLARHILSVAGSRTIGLVTAFMATLVGSPPNAIAAGLLNISFLEWLAYGMPVSLVMLVVAIPILWWTYRP